MGKKRSLYSFLTRFFVCKAESTNEKGKKKRKWCLGILKTKNHYHALKTTEKKIKDHEEDKKQHTIALTIAMTAAAEAAVAAANAAAELARLVRSPEDLERRTQITAAIKIQSFYRAHLAWKALIGLRGVVKLQAVIRGEITRQKVLNKLKNPQRSKIHQICVPALAQVSKICNEKQDFFSPQNNRKNNHIFKDSNPLDRMKKLKFGQKHQTEEHNSPSFRSQIMYTSRRHYQLSPDRSDDMNSLPNSPIFPGYMATTKSFMAKARSLSTPRQRLSFLDGYCTHGSSFGMVMLASSSSFKGNYRHMHL